MTMTETPQPQPRRNWDPVVKLTHWGIVVAVIGNALFTKEGGTAHVWVGYGLGALLVLRLLWGLIGPAEARFSAFPPSPARAIAHVRAIVRGDKSVHASHNPLGALMVYAIWGVLGLIIASGIAMSGLPKAGDPRETIKQTNPAVLQASATDSRKHEDENEGAEASKGTARDLADRERRARSGASPIALHEGEENEEADEHEEEGPLGEIHEAAVNLLYLLIALHLAGVIFETRRSGKQIVLAMAPRRR